MANGTVKFFDTVRNFGFIRGEDGRDYFVHQGDITGEKNIIEKDKVTFDIVEGDRGPKAKNVKKV